MDVLWYAKKLGLGSASGADSDNRQDNATVTTHDNDADEKFLSFDETGQVHRKLFLGRIEIEKLLEQVGDMIE